MRGIAIGPAAAEPLARALKGPNPVVRWEAANALGKLGPAARGTHAALRAALTDRDKVVRTTAAEAIQAMQKQK